MYTYYPKCRPSELPRLLSIGVMLGALVQHTDDADQVVTRAPDDGSVWDPIGAIYRETGELDAEGMPVREPLLDPDGAPFWHGNLTSPVHLYARALALAADRPEVAAALDDLRRLWMLDESGEPNAPANPARTLWEA
ncbi:hypothetical protein ABXN37_29060 [Piscinibacter sakaiensis]|nr:hypothetical protein [Piscinibacter sakaiensis]